MLPSAPFALYCHARGLTELTRASIGGWPPRRSSRLVTRPAGTRESIAQPQQNQCRCISVIFSLVSVRVLHKNSHVIHQGTICRRTNAKQPLPALVHHRGHILDRRHIIPAGQSSSGDINCISLRRTSRIDYGFAALQKLLWRARSRTTPCQRPHDSSKQSDKCAPRGMH